MKNEFQMHKVKDKIKWIITGVAIFLAFVMIAGICMQIYAKDDKFKPSNWFKKTECVHVDEDSDGKCDECGEDMPDSGGNETAGGAIINASVNKGVRLMSARITPATYNDYGIDTQAETAYTLTATVLPSDAEDKSVDWSVAWKNPSSTWASGKTVTNYVTVTPQTGTTPKATVACLAAFGEQIIVKATSRDNPDVSGTCTVDYAQKVQGVTFAIGNVSFTNGGKTTVDFDVSTQGFLGGKGGKPAFGCNLSNTYTIAEEVEYSSITFNISYSGSPYIYQRTISPETTSNITFDRSFFVKESGCKMIANGIEITAQNFYTYSSSEFSNFVGVFNNVYQNTPNIVFSATTKYGGTIDFSSTLLFSVVNSTSVTGVSLSNSSLRF